jgi:hypothetical protein
VLADSDAAAGDMDWRGDAASMVSIILPDRAFPCSGSFAAGEVGNVKSSNVGGSDNDKEKFVRSNGDSFVPGISVVTRDLFSVNLCG